MGQKADKELLRAVLEPRKPGALQKIADACAAGADPNGICPECSTSAGPVRAGSTLLTHSVHEWASNAVKKLLECGADPNLADENGWTPWMASTLVDESKQSRIQEALVEYGATRSGEHIGPLARAIAGGNVAEATALMESDADLGILATFRVDLVGHQIRNNNAAMLELLLTRNMKPNSTHLLNAIRSDNFAAVDLLLGGGLAPERPEGVETPLMTAAAMGNLEIVKRLVEAGADPNRSASDDGEWTASFYANQAGKTEVANWLAARMSEETLESQEQLSATRDPKYQRLYEQATASETLSTDDIVAVLSRWDDRYGITVKEASGDSVTLEFASLPEKLVEIAREMVDLCPDIEDDEHEVLVELKRNKRLFLWWD